MDGGVPEPHTGWTFLTNHARVLATIADNHSARIRDIAAHCRLTERAVQKIISDLERDGYLSHTREGRGNVYSIDPGKVLRHPAEAAGAAHVQSEHFRAGLAAMADAIAETPEIINVNVPDQHGWGPMAELT